MSVTSKDENVNEKRQEIGANPKTIAHSHDTKPPTMLKRQKTKAQERNAQKSISDTAPRMFSKRAIVLPFMQSAMLCCVSNISLRISMQAQNTLNHIKSS